MRTSVVRPFAIQISGGADLSSANLAGAYLTDANLLDAELSYANLSDIRYVTAKQLQQAKSLFNCKNLNPELKEELEATRPCLFTKAGC